MMYNKPNTKKEIIYDYDKLFRYGLNRLSEREFSRVELKKKMGYYQQDETIIHRALDDLETKGYLSDYKRAKSIYNQYIQKESINKIKQRIMLKGVKKESLMTLLDELEDKKNSEDEYSAETLQAKDLLVSKYKEYDKERKDKMIRFLASKGFRYNDISKAINLFSQL